MGKKLFLALLMVLAGEMPSRAASQLPVQMDRRVITPNGDGVNDRVAFILGPSDTASARTQIYNLRGRRVGQLNSLSSGNYVWDGRDDSGRVVESGPYLVQISRDNALWNGVVLVAK